VDAIAPPSGSVHQEPCCPPPPGGLVSRTFSLRRPHLLGALAFIGLAAAFVVAMVLGSAPGGHQATAVEWTVEILILVGAFLMVAGRAARS
jgi:hypothetical protein